MTGFDIFTIVYVAYVGVLMIVWLIVRAFGDELKKKSSKHQFPSEKKSRARVADILGDSSTSDKDRLLSLNSELGVVMNSIFISKEWEDELFKIAMKIKEENNFKFEDLYGF